MPDAAHEPDRPQVSAGIFETVLNTEYGRITHLPVRIGTPDQGWLYCHVFRGAGKPKNAISIFFTPDPPMP